PPPMTGPCPVTPPPYTPIQFITPYSGAFPMSSNPALNINSVTGYLNGTPDIDGRWVVGVCVQEWRGATLIGTHYRDFQFNVVTCSITVLAQFNDQSNPAIVNSTTVINQYCNGNTIQFTNNSINGTAFTWDFGDPTTSADTSHLANPSYTYPDTGAYQVSLIANPGKPCADTIKKKFYIYPVLAPTFTAPPPQCITGNSFNFNVGGLFAPTYSTFNWNFGINASIITSTVQNPTGVVYNASGNFPVTVLVKQKMCQKLLKDTVKVYPVPKSSFKADSVTGCDPVVLTFTNNSTAGGTPSYFWQFGNGGTSTLANPTHTFTPAGVYGVTLTVISTAGCVDTNKFVVPGMVTANIRPTAGFSLTPTETTIFDPDITFTDQSVNGTSWYYTFGDGNSSLSPNPMHTYTNYGDFTIVQTVVNGFGCPDTAVRVVHILPEFRFWVPNAFTPKNKDGLNDVFLPIVFGVENYVFEIYDRWGERIFKTNDTQKAWDGTRLGSPCQQDVYVWMITFFNLVTERDEVHYGSVTLLK
ncbi:MAG TPA: PKD domain-containing protein, partial [Bacteroidia bacterium]|nr:PKD domain-containing protein [Bacteroidia bacterium]